VTFNACIHLWNGTEQISWNSYTHGTERNGFPWNGRILGTEWHGTERYIPDICTWDAHPVPGRVETHSFTTTFSEEEQYQNVEVIAFHVVLYVSAGEVHYS